MACGFETIAEFAQCAILVKEFLATARPWIELGLSLLGIGTVGLLAVLTWALKKHRHDIERLQSTEEALRSASKRAMEAQADAEGRAARSEQNLVRALDELSLVRAPIDAQLAEAKSTIAALQSKLDLVRNASCDNEEFWSREPDTAKRMPDYIGRLSRSIPVLLFANQKGGVGKTTLATNVAACFAERGERVLVIDLDYQGSATSLMLAQASERPQEFPSMVDLLHGESLNDLWHGTAIKAAHSPNLDYVSCWYSFEKLERSMEYQWALDDVNDDIRFRLARAILSDHVQTTYARVLIDAPPRMTAGFMNGFCASTHLFVPMVVDRVSAVAVGTFARRYKELVPKVNPALRFAGIVGTMTRRRHLVTAAEPAANAAEKAVRDIVGGNDNYFIRNALMEHTTKISYSTEAGIPYLQQRATRPMFEAITDEIARRAPLRKDSKQ
jgi:cellulose biosynthesis protein BcsQ